MSIRPRSISLVSRVLFAIAIAGLLPLIAVTVSALNGYRLASDHAMSATTTVLDDASLAALQLRTQETARQLGSFLDARGADALALALLPPDPAAFTRFAAVHTSGLWYPTGTRANPVERRDQFLLFRELVAVDSSGRLLTRIVDGKAQSDPGDPSRLAAYLTNARALGPDALSVSHLSRLYMPRSPDEAARAPGADYATFDGVYRFVAPRRTADGIFDGAVMLALDARHVMEFVIHIQPILNNPLTVWPNYDGGNYAYLFDDQGWTIAHPRLWTMRGNDASGQPVPAVSEQMSPAERDRHPFNAQLGGWADPNLPIIFEKGRSGDAGFVITTNQQGTRKATTYAPVPFAEGDYQTKGVFAVLAVGANTVEFHRSATTVVGAIEAERRRLQLQMGIVVALALVLLALVGFAISRMLVRPLAQLTTVARHLKEGEFDEDRLVEIRQRRFADEVTILADVFAEMGRQVIRREKQLRTEIADLHIQIDSRRRQQQVEEITETDYFRTLRNTATRLRSRPQDRPPPQGDPE